MFTNVLSNAGYGTMPNKSPIDNAEFCDFSGEYSGAGASGSGWIDVLADKSTAHNVGDGLSESLDGFEWLVGGMAKRSEPDLV